MPSLTKPITPPTSKQPYNDLLSTITPLLPTIAEPTLALKILVLIYDLRNFHLNHTSLTRLDRAADVDYYLGSPYFTPSEVTLLTSMKVTHTHTLGEVIKKAFHAGYERRYEFVDVEQMPHYNLADCPAMDLARVLEQTFCIRGARLASLVDIRALRVAAGVEAVRPWADGVPLPPLFHE